MSLKMNSHCSYPICVQSNFYISSAVSIFINSCNNLFDFSIVKKGTKIDKQEPSQTIDEYISQFPENIKKILERIRAVIREAAPDASEKISYQMPTFYLHGNLVHFAAFKTHIGFYPVPSGIEKFKEELPLYKGGKGSVQFPLDQPIPYDLIRRITLFRVEENTNLEITKTKKKK